jgi:hypothetical protein
MNLFQYGIIDGIGTLALAGLAAVAWYLDPPLAPVWATLAVMTFRSM